MSSDDTCEQGDRPGDWPGFVARVCDLYQRDGWSTRKIAEALGVGRRAVDRALRAAAVPVAPRGAGRRRPDTRRDDPDDLAERLLELYTAERLTRRQAGEKLGLPEWQVRSRLAELGVPARSRGRYDREDRRDIADVELIRHYRDGGLTARAVAERLGVSVGIVLRAAHDHGIPVRPGAAVGPETEAIELVEAMYADPQVRATLDRHGVPIVPATGPIWQRFPTPLPLTGTLYAELYLDCGVSTTGIELLTGQPATMIARTLRRAGVALRPSGGRSPFRRRCEARHR